MKKQFKHYVITRFNIELEGLSHYKNPDWVAERYELFAKNLYLSLLNQQTLSSNYYLLCTHFQNQQK